MRPATLVIPCYNEERRLRAEAFFDFFRWSDAADVLFVDDGSCDGTVAVLAKICSEYPERARFLRLPANGGKAEAVRRGVLEAVRRPVEFVGFWDADLATPLESVHLFLAEFGQHPEAEAVLGSRVRLLGRTIERHALRHYAGRGFATAVSLLLNLAVYDTQCGAKLFRRTPTLESIFGAPFLSRWIFDVEILARLDIERTRDGGAAVTTCVRELPLPVWRDVAGSKIRLHDVVCVSRDLWRIYRWRRRSLGAVTLERSLGAPPAPSQRAKPLR